VRGVKCARGDMCEGWNLARGEICGEICSRVKCGAG